MNAKHHLLLDTTYKNSRWSFPVECDWSSSGRPSLCLTACLSVSFCMFVCLCGQAGGLLVVCSWLIICHNKSLGRDKHTEKCSLWSCVDCSSSLPQTHLGLHKHSSPIAPSPLKHWKQQIPQREWEKGDRVKVHPSLLHWRMTSSAIMQWSSEVCWLGQWPLYSHQDMRGQGIGLQVAPVNTLGNYIPNGTG